MTMLTHKIFQYKVKVFEILYTNTIYTSFNHCKYMGPAFAAGPGLYLNSDNSLYIEQSSWRYFVPSECYSFMDKPTRCFSRSMLMIFTFTVSPTETTSIGLFT